MADEAFALSPISARASLPSEEDYEAISQAFMETSRGRWFLGEYAKRNRNADTRMVLDAVARIEKTLPRRSNRPPTMGSPRRWPPSAARSMRPGPRPWRHSMVSRLEESLAPVRKGARIIREICWRWREIGADGRICDLLDSQVSAIEAGLRTNRLGGRPIRIERGIRSDQGSGSRRLTTATPQSSRTRKQRCRRPHPPRPMKPLLLPPRRRRRQRQRRAPEAATNISAPPDEAVAADARACGRAGRSRRRP